MKIFCCDNSELAHIEANHKGHRNDIYVEIDNKYYNLKVYDLVRIKQDFYSELKDYGFYAIEPNIVLVQDVNIEQITKTIEFLVRQKYFDYIKPIDEESIPELVIYN